MSTPASSCLDSDRSSSAAGVMDPGDFEGNFVSELVKVAPVTTGYASQVRRVCDSAVCGLVSAPDMASGTDLFRPVAGVCSAAAHAAAGAGENHSKNAVSECRLRRRLVADPPGLALHATADESKGIIGLREVIVSGSSLSMPINSSTSSMDVACVVPASAAVALSATASSSSCPLASCVAAVHARRTVTSMHALNAHNSWLDTGWVLGPSGRRSSKGGVSGPAEDLRPAPEVQAGVNFRPAGGVREQVAGLLPRRQPGTGTRQVRGGAVTPSPHPEVPHIQFVSPGRVLDIRQSMGCTKVCGTARSGIWVLKGNARTCMFPANLDHLRVEWMKRGTYNTAWVTPGHNCLCSYTYGHGAAVRPQTNNAIWHGVIGLWSRVAPLLSPWCGKKDVPTGVNLNQYAGPGSLIRWHSDNEPSFGPQNSPELIVSLSLGNSVEFMVRRGALGKVPSSIRLDHGDVLVMDGLAQSEYEHCTVPGLQGPRVNLTYRWVAQHTASCPLAGVVGCVLPTCAQGLVEPSSRWVGGRGT